MHDKCLVDKHLQQTRTFDSGPYTAVDSRIHWLTLTTDAPIQRVQQMVRRVGDEPMGVRESGRYNHPRHVLFGTGLEVYYGGLDGQPVVLQWDGEACDRVNQRRVFEAVATELTLKRHSCKCTRIDFARDVAGESLVWAIRDAFRAGHYTGHIRRKSVRIEEDDEGGRTCYIGSKSSLLRLCVYDRRGPTRFEFRLRKERADHAFNLLIKSGFTSAYRSAVQSFGSIHREWWGIVDEPGDVELPDLAKEQNDLKEAVAWVNKQIGPSLWMLLRVGVGLDELTRDPGKLRPEQRRQMRFFIDEAERNGLSVSAEAYSRAGMIPREEVTRASDASV